MWTANVRYQMMLQALGVSREEWPSAFARKFSQQEADRYLNGPVTISFPDFFVECDKKGDWYVIGGEYEDCMDQFDPMGPYPSKAHAINAGVQTFWSN